MSTLSSKAVEKPIRVLVYYDVEGWAWHYKAMALKEHLQPEFHVDITAHGSPEVAKDYDYIVIFGYYMLDVLKGVPPTKILLGLSNNGPEYIEKTREALLDGRAVAGVANSVIGYEGLKGAGDIYLTENGVDTSFFHPSEDRPEEFSICWVGNPNSDVDKGVDIIRNACERTQVPLKIHMWDASKGDISGVAPRERLRNELYWRSSAFVCASKYDGTPNPALESLACGLPVLSTRVGNMPEAIVDGVNGFFFERNVESLVEAIEKLRAADYEAMSRSARASMEPAWSWKHKAQNYGIAIKTIIAKGERG